MWNHLHDTKLEEERPDQNLFAWAQEAQEMVAGRRQQYSLYRPHNSPGYLPSMQPGLPWV